MSTTPSQPSAKDLSEELKALLNRGNQGDQSVLPELKKAFDDNPDLALQIGDLAHHAEESLLALATSKSITAHEAIARHAAELRVRLGRDSASELERLLIDRIVISWIQVYAGDIDLVNQQAQTRPVFAAIQAAQKRLDQAHARYLGSIKALAVVRKLVKPPLSALDLLSRPVAETAAQSGRTGRRGVANPAEGLAVAN